MIFKDDPANDALTNSDRMNILLHDAHTALDEASKMTGTPGSVAAACALSEVIKGQREVERRAPLDPWARGAREGASVTREALS